MDVRDITAENVAKAVGGTVEREGNVLCCCPIHEASGTHNSSLLLSITTARRILFHCRSQNCDCGRPHLTRWSRISWKCLASQFCERQLNRMRRVLVMVSSQ